MHRKIVATFLICSLMSATSVFAEGEANTSVSKSRGNSEVVGEILDSNITRRLVSRMGEPGFYASRFLKLRSTVNKPACTYSEQTAKIATITAIVGDLTTHAYDYFQGKKLEKEYADKLEKIEAYEKELKASGKKILDYQSGVGDIQLDSLKFLKAQAELELKRAEMASIVAYVTLGLNVTSKILAMIEAGAEAASTGVIAAKAIACKKALKPEEVIKEAKTSKTSLLSNDPVSWYLVPFKYIIGTDFYKGYRSYSKGLDKNEFAKEQKEAGNIDAENIDQVALHAGYAEEMLVDIIYDVYKKWSNGKRDVTEEINNFNKNGKELNGILKFLKQTRLDRVGIRFAVRSLIKANLIQIDAFASSGVGRTILFSHNVYIVYKTISDNKAQVDYAKHKIAIIDKTIKDIESKTTWTPLFNQFIDSILPQAVAVLPPRNDLFPKPPCAIEILPTCDLKNYNLMSSEANDYFRALPKDAQLSQNTILTNNYALKAALNLATGKVSYESIDVKKLEAESIKLEEIAKNLEKQLASKDKNFAANYHPQLEKMKNEMIFSNEMIASYKSAVPENSNVFESALSSTKTGIRIDTPVGARESVVGDMPAENIKLQGSEKGKPEDQYVYEVETISKKESNLFEIITNRYMQVIKREEL